MRRRKPKTQPISKRATLEADARKIGAAIVPAYLPTEERAHRGDLALVVSHGWDFGDQRPGHEPPRRIVTGIAVKDRASDARVRLRRFRGLTPEQIRAGEIFELDYQAARLEPRMAANLNRTGGGYSGSVANTVIDARDRVHAALQQLRLGGHDVLRIIEAVVLNGATSSEAGSVRYSDAEKGRVHTAALVGVGLNLLVEHYRIGRK